MEGRDMIPDFDLFGVMVSPLLFCLLLAFGARLVLSKILSVIGLYRWVWHRSLFDLSLYIVLVWGVYSALSILGG